jgi:hypothetical protein
MQVTEVDVQYLIGQPGTTQPLLMEERHVKTSRLRLDRLEVFSGLESLLISTTDFAVYLMSRAHDPDVVRWMSATLAQRVR